MTGVIEGVFLAGGALKLIERYQGSEEIRLAQQACVRDLFSKYLSKDFDNEGLDTQSMRVSLRPGANQHISAAFHHLDQQLQEKQQRLLDIFQKPSTLSIRDSVTLYLKKWLASISAEEDSLDPKEVTRHLDFTRQMLMHADLFISPGTNAFLRALAFTAEQLEHIADHLYGENRTASRVLDRICHAGRETIQLVIPIILFSIVSVIPEKTKQTHFDTVTLLQSRQTTRDFSRQDGKGDNEPDDNASEDFDGFWDTPVGDALFAVLNSPHCIDLLGLKTLPVAPYKLNIDMVRPFAVGFSNEVIDYYVQFFKQLDSFIYFMRVLQLYQNLAAASGDVLMCYLYSTLNHLLHEIEVALVALHQVGAKLLGAGKTQLQSMLKRSKTLTEEQMTWICRLRFIDEESLGANHRCLFDLFCEMRQLSALDRLPSIQNAIARNVRSLRDAFHSHEFQSRASLPLEGTAMRVLENVLERVAAVEGGGAASERPAIEDVTWDRRLVDQDVESEICSYDDNDYAYADINTYGVLNKAKRVSTTPPDTSEELSKHDKIQDVNGSLQIHRALDAQDSIVTSPSSPESIQRETTPASPSISSPHSVGTPPTAHPSASSTAPVATTKFLPEVMTAALINKVVATTSKATESPNLIAFMKKALGSPPDPTVPIEPFPNERAFFEALWSIMSPCNDTIRRWDVARLVGGAVHLAEVEKAIWETSRMALPANLQHWTFAHLTVLLRALSHMRQNDPVVLDKAPTILAKVEGYMWDVERERLRIEWPTQ